MRVTAAVVLAIAGAASAQLSIPGLSGLSSSCTSAAGGLITSGFGSCVSILSLANVLSVPTNSSLVQPLNTWLNSACANTCDSSTLQSASSSIQSGCSSDLQNGNAIASALQVLTSNYTQVKEAVCLQATSNSTFCLSNILSDVQSATGQNISVNALEGLLTDPSSATQLVQGVNSSTVCTDCTHALVTKLAPLVMGADANASDSALSAVTQECGSGFADGQVPSTVKEFSGSSSGSPSGTQSAGSVQSTSLNNAAAGIAAPASLGALFLGAVAVVAL